MTSEIAVALAKITDDVLQTYEEDGAVCLRGIWEQKWVDLIAAGIERDMKHPGPYCRVHSSEDDPGRFFQDYYVWLRIPEIREFALESPAGAVAARLMRSNQVNFFYDGIFAKEPGTLMPSKWHQDQPSYNVDGHKVIILWTPIHPVSKGKALELVRGSHRWGKWFIPNYFGKERVFGSGGGRFEPAPDLDANRNSYEFLAWDMEPGDCVAFHGLTLHGAPGNLSSNRRWALSTTWLGDDAIYGERPGEVDPKLEGGHRFKAGDRLDVEAVFPRVWPRKDVRIEM